MKGLRLKQFFIRLSNWEYWPRIYVYFPLYIYYVWLSIKARSPWFFSASNPGIETGGMLGESKIEIFNIIPDHLKPITIYIKSGTSLPVIKSLLGEHQLSFPIICKPDRGERGFQVSKIANDQDLEAYVLANKVDYIIQSYCDFQVELGVYYRRYPWEESGEVFSVVKKEFLFVEGDGIRTLEQLILNNNRAILQWDHLSKKFNDRMNEVLPSGMHLELVSIGNHARGTKFIDGKDLIDDDLNKVFDNITRQIPGVYFCRYDLRTTSEFDLKQGKNIFIVELNGVGAEPAHIYDPNYKLLSAWKDLINQWTMVYKIAQYNKRHGVPYMTTKAVKSHLKLMKAYRTLAES
jgi:hypothetical protein